jgi:ParB-like chromosome segregation protein Spo0J
MNIDINLIDAPATLLRESNPEVGDLISSIGGMGILQPLLVRPGEIAGRYTLVAGKRRLTAALQLDFKTVPVEVRDDLTEIQARTAELVENLARKDLPAHREAEGTVELIRLRFDEAGMEIPSDEVKKLLWKLSNEQRGTVAKSLDDITTKIILETFEGLGRSFGGFVVSVLPAMSWPPDVREAMEHGLPRSSAQKIAQIKDPTMRQEALTRVGKGEKASEVKSDLLGGAKQHRELEADLTVAERLEKWPRKGQALLADPPQDYPEPSWSEVLPRTLLIEELLARTVKPGNTVAMLNCELEDVMSALLCGVNVLSVNEESRFEGELTEFAGDDDGLSLILLHHRGVGGSRYSDEAQVAENLLDEWADLSGRRALLLETEEVPTISGVVRKVKQTVVGVASNGTTARATLLLII